MRHKSEEQDGLQGQHFSLQYEQRREEHCKGPVLLTSAEQLCCLCPVPALACIVPDPSKMRGDYGVQLSEAPLLER